MGTLPAAAMRMRPDGSNLALGPVHGSTRVGETARIINSTRAVMQTSALRPIAIPTASHFACGGATQSTHLRLGPRRLWGG